MFFCVVLQVCTLVKGEEVYHCGFCLTLQRKTREESLLYRHNNTFHTFLFTLCMLAYDYLHLHGIDHKTQEKE